MLSSPSKPQLPPVPVAVLPDPPAADSDDELFAFEEEEDEDEDYELRRLPDSTVHLRKTTELHCKSLVACLASMIHEGQIELDPPYQRGVVWPVVKQASLINSIMLNYYVPPIVFATRFEDGVPIKVCVDGKQRLTSISKFLHGQIPFQDHQKGPKYLWEISATQKNKQMLPARWKEIFSQTKITCVEYPDIGDRIERDMFQRVQMGMTLTAAEKLQALSSPWSTFISALDAQFTSDDHFGDVLKTWSTERGRNWQGIANMVFCCDCYPSKESPTNDRVRRWILQTDRLPTDDFQRRMRQTLSTFIALASDTKYNWCLQEVQGAKTKSAKKVAPVEFIYIGVLLFWLQTGFPGLDRDHTTKAHAIASLRKVVREHHADIRTNSYCANTLWDIITKIVQNPTKFIQAHSDPDFSGTIDSFTAAKGKRTRKRKGGDDSDDEYRPAVVRSRKR